MTAQECKGPDAHTAGHAGSDQFWSKRGRGAECGATAIEYSLVMALIGLIMATSSGPLSEAMGALLGTMDTEISDVTTDVETPEAAKT